MTLKSFHDRLLQRIDELDTNPTAVSKKAKRSDSWLRKILDKPGRVPRGANLSDLANALETNVEWLLHGKDGPEAGFAENEASVYVPTGERPYDSAVAAETEGRDTVDPWVIRGGSLEALGIMSGDVLIADMSREIVEGPLSDGDIVVAQIVDMDNLKARTVIRQIRAGMLVSAPRDPSKAEFIRMDDRTVAIKAVAIGLIRRWR